MISDEASDDYCVPTITFPVFVCLGRTHYGYKYTLCGTCYHKNNNVDDTAGRRKTRSARENRTN